MGFDVYVGPLTRYYSADWKTIGQQSGESNGISVTIVRPNDLTKGWIDRFKGFFRTKEREGALSQAEVLAMVTGWRDQLRDQLKIRDLDWNEGPKADYFADKPAWDCYGALPLWASYDDLPNSHRRLTAEKWNGDPAYVSSANNPQSRYKHLLAETEIWLPNEFDSPPRTVTVSGYGVTVGCSIRLVAELRELNSRTWNASDADVSQWRRDNAEHGRPLEDSAGFGFSVFYELAQKSVTARLPMQLDC